MEKRYFVLKKGYLNVDEDFFYFSDHGNWETCQILEETEVPRLTFFYVSHHIIKVVYTILAIAFVFLLLNNEVNFSGGILLLGTLIHFLDYRYKTQYFKIPLGKIQQIVLRDEKLMVEFLNKKEKIIEHTVKLDDSRETKDIQQYLSTYFNQKLHVA
ncbi:hypothetical protein KORDIASMS9_04326 [Kordia sp. SMS9]|uniref:hypothetical protein n=1 Tax=Kordia sp. SMS9 TaxID=2282170 RepID=UPI000E0CFCE4|nr:hypothetical protein [Kordia sp. SMS9]AXG72064.1 hypothetical protein KORDIASMS9_04326 [Kordia sp. SMS9]